VWQKEIFTSNISDRGLLSRMQMVLDLLWSKLGFLDLMMVWKWYAFIRYYTSIFDLFWCQAVSYSI
jgi:hypothetical protein